jgi:hypothetical protein
MSQRSQVDVELFAGEQRTLLANVPVLFEQRTIWAYAVLFENDRSDRHGTTHVRVTLPGGEVIGGEVSYAKPGTLIFRTHNEFGDAVRMPDDA